MYSADPFAARKEVEQRQAQTISKRRDEATPRSGESVEATLRGSEPRRDNTVSKEFAEAPEVRMAGTLRDLAEDAIKQVFKLLYFALDGSLIHRSRLFRFIQKLLTSPHPFYPTKTPPR
jgi:hypothetical protein